MNNLWSRASVLMLAAGLATEPSGLSQGNPAECLGAVQQRSKRFRHDGRMILITIGSQGDVEKRTGLLRCYISRVENSPDFRVPSLQVPTWGKM